MKEFRIHYSFDIKDSRTEEITYWERGSYDVISEHRDDIDGEVLRKTIRNMAKEHIEHIGEFVCYANYFRIEELKQPKTTNKK